MFYDMAYDGLSKIKDNIEVHRKSLLEFHNKGVLLMAGPLANPTDGAVGIFTNMDNATDLFMSLFLQNF